MGSSSLITLGSTTRTTNWQTNSLDQELDLGKQTAWNSNYTITTQINSLELELNLIRTGHIRLKGEGFSNVSMED